MRSALLKSGLASVHDLATEDWRNKLVELEKIQSEFLALESEFRSDDYRKRWPSDSLHSWSRVWEYPYVYGNLAYLKQNGTMPANSRVADIGSGVTFFPFALSRTGFQVICVDHDSTCQQDLEKAISVMPGMPGEVTFILSGSSSIPLPNQSMNAVVCISVLEHVADPILLVKEFSRILVPRGVCFLTIDLDLKGNLEIGPNHHAKLVEALMDDFTLLYPEKTVHPASLLRTDTGPYPMHQPSRLEIIRYSIQERLVKPLLGRESFPIPVRSCLAIQGFALTKK